MPLHPGRFMPNGNTRLAAAGGSGIRKSRARSKRFLLLAIFNGQIGGE
jgi:hypothetical protein